MSPLKRDQAPIYRILTCVAVLAAAASVVLSAKLPTKEQQLKMHQPTIWADVPDISLVRAGKDYYMSSTTMHMCPGLPIMKSRDLAHWKLVSYAYNTLGEEDALCLNSGKSMYGQGSWASSLRYHNGLFYASTFSLTTNRTYIYTTKDPSRTPWKAISFAPAFHDHSLFFDDDGRIYLVYGSGDIRLIELKPDLSGPITEGPGRIIIRNASTVAGGQVGLPAEGSQLFKVNGKYYLCNIAWPRGGMRTEIVHRADKIDGPYEGRIMFQYEGIAQGGLIDDPKGNWFAYLFQDSGAVGRIPYVFPVQWVDGWPVVSKNSINAKTDAPAIVANDDFNETKLPLVWQWNHNPDNVNWSLKERKGFLRIRTSRTDSDVLHARNTLTQRTFGPTSSCQVCLDTHGLKDGDFAGLLALQHRYGFVGVSQEDGRKDIVVVSIENGSEVVTARLPLEGHTVDLRIDCDFKSRKDEAAFFFSLDGRKWQPIGKPLHMTYDLAHFMGYRFGLFAYSTKQAGGHADFDFFKISGTIAAE